MAEDDPATRNALRAGGAHVVLREHLEHRRAHHAHHDRHREDGDRERGQEELAQVRTEIVERRHVRERRHPSEGARGEEEQERREPEARDADADQAGDAGEIVARAVPPHGGDDAERDADNDGDEE